MQVASQLAVGFITNWMALNTEPMPSALLAGGTTLVMQNGSTKKAVFVKYKNSMANTGDPVIKRTHFYRLWNKHFPTTRSAKWNSFAVCKICTTFRKALENEPPGGMLVLQAVR